MQFRTSHLEKQSSDSRPRVSDQQIAESSPGPHQRLIRRQDGQHILIVRLASGIVQNVPVMVFEGGVQA